MIRENPCIIRLLCELVNQILHGLKKEPASKNIGDEQLSLLRLLAGIVPHEIKILRSLFNANDNHCQLFVRVFFIHDW